MAKIDIKMAPPFILRLTTRGKIIHKILLREWLSNNHGIFSGRAGSNNHTTAPPAPTNTNTNTNANNPLLSRIPGRGRGRDSNAGSPNTGPIELLSYYDVMAHTL